MKAVTGNRLDNGAVVYLGREDALVERFEQARLFSNDEADAALGIAARRVRDLAAAYLIDADECGPVGREGLRESIRRNGPTIRPDLGKQAARANERL